MASTPSRKRTRSRAASRTRRVADMTIGELREMIEKSVERKLAKVNPLSASSTKKTITVQMRQRARSATGRFHSGFSDISSKHDEHLVASYLG
jgi:hypothetical protein